MTKKSKPEREQAREIIAEARSKKDLLEEIEALEEQGDFYYTRTEVLLYLLCDKLPPMHLSGLVSQAKYMTNEMFMRDSATTGLEGFIRRLMLELMQSKERRKAENACQVYDCPKKVLEGSDYCGDHQA